VFSHAINIPNEEIVIFIYLTGYASIVSRNVYISVQARHAYAPDAN
jgi:hypothetical protein